MYNPTWTTEEVVTLAIFTALITAILGIVLGMNFSNTGHGYFYVKSENYGYTVAIDTQSGTSTTVTKHVSEHEAQKLCDTYNDELRDAANVTGY